MGHYLFVGGVPKANDDHLHQVIIPDLDIVGDADTYPQTIRSLYVHNQDLYVGGSGYDDDGWWYGVYKLNKNTLAYIDKTPTFSTATHGNYFVRDMLVHDGYLYVAFNPAIYTQNSLYKIDMSDMSIEASASNDVEIRKLAVHDGELYAHRRIALGESYISKINTTTLAVVSESGELDGMLGFHTDGDHCYGSHTHEVFKVAWSNLAVAATYTASNTNTRISSDHCITSDGTYLYFGTLNISSADNRIIKIAMSNMEYQDYIFPFGSGNKSILLDHITYSDGYIYVVGNSSNLVRISTDFNNVTTLELPSTRYYALHLAPYTYLTATEQIRASNETSLTCTEDVVIPGTSTITTSESVVAQTAAHLNAPETIRGVGDYQLSTSEVIRSINSASLLTAETIRAISIANLATSETITALNRAHLSISETVRGQGTSTLGTTELVRVGYADRVDATENIRALNKATLTASGQIQGLGSSDLSVTEDVVGVGSAHLTTQEAIRASNLTDLLTTEAIKHAGTPLYLASTEDIVPIDTLIAREFIWDSSTFLVIHESFHRGNILCEPVLTYLRVDMTILHTDSLTATIYVDDITPPFIVATETIRATDFNTLSTSEVVKVSGEDTLSTVEIIRAIDLAHLPTSEVIRAANLDTLSALETIRASDLTQLTTTERVYDGGIDYLTTTETVQAFNRDLLAATEAVKIPGSSGLLATEHIQVSYRVHLWAHEYVRVTGFSNLVAPETVQGLGISSLDITEAVKIGYYSQLGSTEFIQVVGAAHLASSEIARASSLNQLSTTEYIEVIGEHTLLSPEFVQGLGSSVLSAPEIVRGLGSSHLAITEHIRVVGSALLGTTEYIIVDGTSILLATEVARGLGQSSLYVPEYVEIVDDAYLVSSETIRAFDRRYLTTTEIARALDRYNLSTSEYIKQQHRLVANETIEIHPTYPIYASHTPKPAQIPCITYNQDSIRHVTMTAWNNTRMGVYPLATYIENMASRLVPDNVLYLIKQGRTVGIRDGMYFISVRYRAILRGEVR